MTKPKPKPPVHRGPRGPQTYRRFKPLGRANLPEDFLFLNHPNAHYRPVLEALFRMRFLTTPHLRAYLRSPKKGVYAPLSKLFHAGLVARRPVYMRDADGVMVGEDKWGSPKTVHVLTPDGLDYLMPDADATTRGLVRNRLAREPLSLRHQVAIAEFHLLLDLGTRDHDDLALHVFRADREDPRMRFHVRTADERGRPFARWPDAFFTLIAGAGARNYLLELDSDDERPRKKSRLAQRFVAYDHALSRGVLPTGSSRSVVPYWERLGLAPYTRDDKAFAPTLHVLFVAPTVKRRDDLRELAVELHRDCVLGTPRFWFLAQEDYLGPDLADAARALFERPVLRGLDGDLAYLVPGKPAFLSVG